MRVTFSACGGDTIREGRLEELENLARKRERREAGLDRVETLV